MLKAWAPLASAVATFPDLVVRAVEFLEMRAIPVAVGTLKCLEGLVPPDMKCLLAHMVEPSATLSSIRKLSRKLKWDRLWTYHLQHPANLYVHESRSM